MNDREDRLLSPKEAAHFIGVAVNTLANWRSIGRGPKFYKYCGHVRYSHNDISDWIDKNKFSSTSAY